MLRHSGKVISQLDFGHGIVMTGTPIENAVDDVWSYFYKDTVEEKILALQQQKQQTADVFHLGGGKLSKEELMGLIE